MSKIRHLLQLHSQGRSKQLISQQTSIARNTVKKYLKQFIGSGLSISDIDALNDKDLEDLFIKPIEKPLNHNQQLVRNRTWSWGKLILHKMQAKKL